MKLKFTKKQIDICEKAGVPFDVTRELSDDQICDIIDLVGDYLIRYCFDKEYYPNHEGDVCYQILDMLGEL